MKREKKTKRYTINVHYDAMVSVVVEAENDEQAMQFAKEEAEEQEFDCVTYSDACVVDVE